MPKDTKRIIFYSIIALCAALALTSVSVAYNIGVTSDMADEDTEPVGKNEGRFNVIVAGCDRVSGLTDVMMLVSIDRANDSVSIMQIPRDTYAKYTESGYKKINGAYAKLGSGERLSAFLSEAMGIKIDKYLVLSPDAFCGIVDAVGGVEIELSRPMYYSDPSQGLHISLKKGKQTLDGKTAEQFVRYRSGYADGDLGRIDAQKIFLRAFVGAVKENMTPVSLTKIAVSLLGKTDTNIGLSDVRLLSDELCGIEDDKITILTAPGKALVASESGASYYCLSADALDEALCLYFGASAGNFDKNRVFLNAKYQSFSNVYNKYVPYKVYTADKIDTKT